LTGIPGHGGGKRFAIEQEMVAAATRGAIKQMDLSLIRGKKVNLFVNAIDDKGTGNLIGGRFSLISQLRGDYYQSPTTTETSVFPRYTTTTRSRTSSRASSDSDTTTTTESSTKTESGLGSSNSEGVETSTSSSDGSSTSSSTSTSTTDSTLPYPETKTIEQEGGGGLAQLGVEFKGLGAYHNSEELTANDLQYLSALLQTYLFLEGVIIVPPSEAEIDVYVTVDVFGTVRTRVEWFIANNEILRAKTSFEILAVDHLSGRLVLPPTVAAAEAEYNEQYILWAGPVSVKKTLVKADPLLSDFTDVLEGEKTLRPAIQRETVPHPFMENVEESSNQD
jgi:hypothetical protein